MFFTVRLFFTILVVGAYLGTLAEAQTNYCNATLCNGKKHIGCNNNGAFSSACASNAKVITMTETLRKNIINKHNTLRNTVAGGSLSGYNAAIRMAPMRWAPELAKLAALNVKQCAMVHDQCRNTNIFRYAGQNLAMIYYSGVTRTVNEVNMQLIQSWFNEYKDCSMQYINAYNNPTNGKAIGHFTAIVQEKSTHIGCAVLRQTKSGRTYHYLACNYAYTNVFNMPVYRKGTRASACKTGTHATYKNLCSLQEKYAIRNASSYN